MRPEEVESAGSKHISLLEEQRSVKFGDLIVAPAN
jgi:hypothetical protein